MAELRLEGFDEMLQDLERHVDGMDESCALAVMAGAEEALKAMQVTVPVRTGGLKKHLKTKGPFHNYIDGHYAFVYPTGHKRTYTPKKGKRQGKDVEVTYNQIGFVLEYGRSNMPARPWMRPAVENNRETIGEAMATTLFSQW